LIALLGLRRPAVEPVYNGKSLHVWLHEYYYGRNSAARHALQHIGTNAIPILLSMLQEKDFYAKSNLTHRLSADLSPMRFVSAATIADRARINLELAVLDTLSKHPAAYQVNTEAALGFLKKLLGKWNGLSKFPCTPERSHTIIEFDQVPRLRHRSIRPHGHKTDEEHRRNYVGTKAICRHCPLPLRMVLGQPLASRANTF